MPDLPIPSIPTELTLEQALQLARQHYEAGQIQQAAGLCQQILKVLPQQADALHLLGLAAHRLGKSGAAVNLIAQALGVQASADFHHSLGTVLQSMGHLQEAVASYESALALRPEFPLAHYHLGLVQHMQGGLDAAADSYRAALHGNPQFAEAHNNLGNVLKDLGRFEQAADCYRTALQLKPVLAAAQNNLGIVLQWQGDLPQAENYYRAALRLAPHFVDAHVQLGAVLQALGRDAEALSSYQAALALDPENETAQHYANALRRINSEQAPPGYVRQLFDSLAGNFDAHLVGKLGYHIPELLCTALSAELKPAPASLDVLDLGCGTGLFGQYIRPHSRSLTGVDLSAKMLEQARAKGVYGSLALADINEYIHQVQDASLDLLAATDVFVYLGDLQSICQHACRVLRQGGAFAFSLEANVENEADYLLQHNGRYAHTSRYIRGLAGQYGMSEALCAPAVIRHEAGQPVQGNVWILRNGSDNRPSSCGWPWPVQRT